MSLQPMPGHVVELAGSIQAPPEVLVLYRTLGRGLPAVLFPAMDPLGDAVAQVDAVGEQVDLDRPLQRLQGTDRRHQFHAVVGSEVFAAGQLAIGALPAEDGPPAARAGIAAAPTISMNDDRCAIFKIVGRACIIGQGKHPNH